MFYIFIGIRHQETLDSFDE